MRYHKHQQVVHDQPYVSDQELISRSETFLKKSLMLVLTHSQFMR